MSKSPLKIMLDANVIIDSYCAWHPHSDAAKRLIGSCGETSFELYFPVHVAKDVLFVLEREFKREATRPKGSLTQSEATACKKAALACMHNMMEFATAVGADGSDVWLADKYLPIHHDFEDNLVLAACKRVKADYLVTNDQELIRNADVVAKTPAQVVELLKLGRLG